MLIVHGIQLRLYLQYYFPNTIAKLIINNRYVDLLYENYLELERVGFRKVSLILDFNSRPSYATHPTTRPIIQRLWNDEDTKIFSASGRIKNLCSCMTLNEEYERIVNHICNKCESVENRLYNEDVMSPQYKKIQAVSILEDCNKITAKANKRGTYETLPSKKEFAKIVATAKYFVENYLDDKAILKESTNAEFNRFIKEESNYISQVL